MDEFKRRFKDLDVSMGIGETSRVTGATTTQIRYWEKKGMVQSLRHGEGQNKRYTYRNIARIMFIKSMIDQGYTLAKAEKEATQHFSLVEAVQRVVKERIRGSEQQGDTMMINLGPLDNDAKYDVVAKVGKHVKLLRKRHENQ